jgi:ATP-dependent Clp protease ATP-binding subunit ClpA
MFERFSREARVAVVLAQQEARELRADAIGPEHLLVGVLRSAGRELSGVLDRHGLTGDAVRSALTATRASFDDDAAALQAIGIDLDAVRAAADRAFGDGALERALRGSQRRRRRWHTPLRRSAKKALELALREAVLHKDSVIGAEHLLLGIVRGGDDVAVGLITEHVPAHRLRADVVALLQKAA